MSRHRYQLNVRFSDVDLYRHVNNVKYFEYIKNRCRQGALSVDRPTP